MKLRILIGTLLAMVSTAQTDMKTGPYLRTLDSFDKLDF